MVNLRKDSFVQLLSTLDISIKLVDKDDGRFQDLEELWVHGLPDSEGGRQFALEKVELKEGTWNVKGCIDFPGPVYRFVLAVKNKKKEEVGRMEYKMTSPTARGRLVHIAKLVGKAARGSIPVVTRELAMKCGTRVTMAFTGHRMRFRDLAHFLAQLGHSAHHRFEHTGNIFDIIEAVSLWRRLLEITPKDDPNLPGRVANLGVFFSSRFHRTGKLADLDEAISLLRKGLEITPDGHTDLPFRLVNLGLAFHARFTHLGELPDLDKGIVLMQRALEMTPHRHPDSVPMLSNLGLSFKERFLRLGELADIDKAVSLGRNALKITPNDHRYLSHRLSDLAGFLQARFFRTGKLADLNEAILLSQRVLETTPDGHCELAYRLGNLGGAFYARFTRIGDLADINEAISLIQRAMDSDTMPDGHSARARRLCLLGNYFQTRYFRTMELVDLNEAISLGQRALETTPAGHPDLAFRLGGLEASFKARFYHVGELADIDEAISLGQRALKATPDGHPDLASRLCDLGASFHARFLHIGELADLATTISLRQRALENTPDDHQALAFRLFNLGTSLHSHFQQTQNPADLDKAISLKKRALAITPDGHPSLTFVLSGLGSSLNARFLRTQESSDLDEAISYGRKALKITPHGHPTIPSLLHDLGIYYASKSLPPNGTPSDISASIFHCKQAAMSSHGRVSTRLEAARWWAWILQQHFPASPELLQAFETALSLVALAMDLGQTVEARYLTIERRSGVALDAISAAIGAGRPDKALEWLEQGRCLVWGQLNSLRSPVDELRALDKPLADKITAISQLLDAAGLSRLHSNHGISLAEKISLEIEARRHQDLVMERDKLITRARAHPGFQRFLYPPSCSSLLGGLPPSGYVIIVNAHVNRCDALVASGAWKDVLHVPLPAFSRQKAEAHRQMLKDSFGQHGIRMRNLDMSGEDVGTRGIRKRSARPSERPMARLLQGLWIDVVKPIFDTIGLEKHDPVSGGPYPRIWWCPTDIMSFLPIHAAGVYADAKECLSALDYAIPSYTPTIASLTHRVRTSRPISKGVSGLLMTSQPNAGPARVPGIPGTTKEVQCIYARACEEKVRALKLDGNEVTVKTYLDSMERFSSVHLACHGSQKADDPLASRFLFHDGSLELRAIIKKNLDNADLAFLSACQTSTGDEKLADEAVHLAAGMLAAGYRRVVATMWAIGDKEAPQVAQDFYDYIFDRREEGDMGGFDGSHSAEALHYAIQQLRSRLDSSDRSLLAWAPYVHWGY